MSFNTFGHLFRVTTFGESHGVAIGCVIDGCPPRIALTEADIQPYLDKRRPGQSRFTTQRREPDQVKILSGVFIDEASGEQVTTGTPIALVIDNVDPRSKDYSDIKDKYRPGHADYTYDAKYGIRDYRGGGRQSARETATRVAAGAIARKIVPAMTVRGALIQMGEHRIERTRWNWDEVERNRRPGRHLLAGRFIDEYAGEDFHLVRLAPLGGEARLARPPLVEIGLDVGLGQRDAGWATVDHATDRGPVAFAEGRDPEKMAEGVERHGVPSAAVW